MSSTIIFLPKVNCLSTELVEWPELGDREQLLVLVRFKYSSQNLIYDETVLVATDEVAYYVDLQLFLGGEAPVIPVHYEGTVNIDFCLMLLFIITNSRR